MKLDKRLLLVLLPLCILSGSVIAYAAYTVLSPVREVTVGYVLALPTPSVSGATVTLVATLTNNGAAVSGASIVFYHCTASGDTTGNSTALGTVVTGSGGVATLAYSEAANGLYHYIAKYTAS